ncbi:MAG: hypothetical protein ACERKO_07055 [Acetanaerobacterium sp.]
MKMFFKVLLFIVAAAGLICGIYQLLNHLYPHAIKRYYSPIEMVDIHLEDC